VFRNERGGAYYLEKHDIAKWDQYLGSTMGGNELSDFI